MSKTIRCGLLLLLIPSGAALGREDILPAAAKAGQRLFSDPRFARDSVASPVSCVSCHAVAPRISAAPVRNPVPDRGDGQRQTPRHAQGMIGALEPAAAGWGLLHWDGEFASVEELVKGAFTGRNFGWLPGEKALAVQHFAQVIRGDPEIAALVRRIDPQLDTATDEQLLGAGATAMGAYLETFRFSRAESGVYNGSAYDAFLEANRLPQAPAPGEATIHYTRRLHEAVAGLKMLRFIDDPARKLVLHDQPFRFGELELQGMRIFFRGTLGYGQNSSAGNCAECHAPPRFTDFAFHNTGAAQDSYDAVHGAGAFAKLVIPTLAERAKDPDRWLPASAQHPQAKGVFRSGIAAEFPGQADLGLWNVYGNLDLPAPQPVIERKLNAEGRLTPDEVLALTLGRFKTPTVRDLGQSAPFLHDGRFRSIEEVLEFYRRMSDLAREGKLRNPPPEYHSMHLQPGDVAPLAAFLRSLNEDYQPR